MVEGSSTRWGRTARRMVGRGGLVIALVLTASCTAAEPQPASATSSSSPASAPSSPPPPVAPEPSAPPFPAGPELPAATATPQDVVTGLVTPWALAFLPGGAVLVTLRDPGQVLLLTDAGAAPLTGPGAEALAATTRHGGEGGLLGVAVADDVAQTGLVYLYRTTDQGNEVVRTVLDAVTGTLGELVPVLQGIPAAGNHNGGRIAFGPDGQLYVGTGDAGTPDAAQDPGSLAGKILRVTPEGAPAPGNPTPGSPVWSLGHRNVQGLGWDPDGRMLASELGQNTYDELNVIEPGNNYGWPVVEGRGGVAGMVDPVVTWSTDVASPSGIAVTDAGVYVAALRGQRLWAVGLLPDSFADPVDAQVGELGRLRDVHLGPDGALWILTQNTDGRGSPRDGDDRLVRIELP
ncbi:sorbosone dehydrogenase family protein [Cellulomonas sp. KRMCY2]|uniref:PQQ-dependent sugar dehydrogenase n=1 Tax=Cellulomonas sp. KRMCY2 TaxID=1304865 RepID=UPI0004B23CFC|nr:PQQ-dependent sugar dehydrogenase [Cellulomonas sp. KRMCY2]